MGCTDCHCHNIHKNPQEEEEYCACLKEAGDDILNLFDELEVPDKEQTILLKMANRGFCWQQFRQMLDTLGRFTKR